MALASSSVSGRRVTVSQAPPTSRTSAATAWSSSLLPDASTSLPPSAPSAMAQPRPNAPDAPVMIATLPSTSNSERGLRKVSEIMRGPHRTCDVCRSEASPPALEAKRLLGVEHRDHAERAALALRPAPGKGEERASLARNLVDVAADVLDTRDAVRHHDLVSGFPEREIVDDMAAGLGEILIVEVRLRRTGPVRPEEGAERMIERLHVDADEFDAAFNDPLGGLFVQTRRIGVIVRVVAVLEMAAGIDHQDVVLADCRLGVLQVLRGDHAPFAF